MESINPPYQIHCFICTNLKEKGESCAPKGSLELRDRLKTWVKEQNLHRFVRINNTGCLGQCENGIAVAIYPQNRWFLKVTPENFEAIQNEIKQLCLEHKLV